MISVALLIACGSSSGNHTTGGDDDDGGDGMSAASCHACYGDLAHVHAWCAATQTCLDSSDGAGCAWGLVDSDAKCDMPGLGAQGNLAIDCRGLNTDDPRCGVGDLPPKTVGTGPNDNFYRYGGGFVDAANHRLIIAFSCLVCAQKDSGVMAIDLTTGDRTLVSGAVNDVLTGVQRVGTGDQVTGASDVERLPDGRWVVLDSLNYGAQVFVVDPATGNRTLRYPQAQLQADQAICKLGANPLVVGHRIPDGTPGLANLAVAPDGKLYARAFQAFTNGGTGAELDLYAIVELTSTGTPACRVVTAYASKDATAAVGTGPGIGDDYRWLTVANGVLYANIFSYYVHAIDVVTGNRTMVSSANTQAKLGTGDYLGESFLAPSHDGTQLLTVGKYLGSSYGGFVVIDPATGNRTTLVPAGGPERNSDGGAPIAHPTLDGVYIVGGEGYVNLYEPATGNSVYLSR